MKGLTIYMLRHGETTWNADNNRYCGRSDIELTKKGLQQAQIVREQLEDVEFTGVYSSPLQRAHNTAKIASGREVITDERLIEADFGTWEKKTREEFIAEDPKLWNDWMLDPATARAGGTGETGMDVVLRVDHFFTELLAKHESGNFMIVAHNGVNRLYMAYKLGMPLRNYRQLVQLNSAITQFTLDEKGVLTLQFLNSKLR